MSCLGSRRGGRRERGGWGVRGGGWAMGGWTGGGVKGGKIFGEEGEEGGRRGGGGGGDLRGGQSGDDGGVVGDTEIRRRVCATRSGLSGGTAGIHAGGRADFCIADAVRRARSCAL